MQIVYLSNRPAVLAGTLSAVARHCPWIDHAVVCVPQNRGDDFHSVISESPFTGPVALVNDEVIAPGADLSKMDHVTRNVTLRRALIEGEHTDETFILSDDDYRPLVMIPETDFVTEDGRHQGYWFYDLAEWPSAETDYDRAQIRTLAVLRVLDRPTLAFGSHMPQIMTRDHWRASFAEADAVGAGPLVDEWSLYFNLSMHRAPDDFADPLPFRTLAWPQWPHQWPHVVAPHPIRFENHHPEHEADGGLFAGLGPVITPADAIERVRRWREAEIAIGELRFDKSWHDPWTRGQAHRRGVAAAMRAASKVRRYSSLADRTAVRRTVGPGTDGGEQ